MRVPLFNRWEPPSPDLLPPALAAAGVIWGTGQTYPFPDDVQELASRLDQAFAAPASLVVWNEPRFFEDDFVRHTKAEVLVEAWRRAIARTTGRVRLAIGRCSPETRPWYLQQLVPSRIRCASVFIEAEPLSPLMEWSWPLRIGILPGKFSQPLEQELDTLIRRVDWFDAVADRVDATAPGAVCDFLLVPAGAAVLEDLFDLPAPVLAHCLILFGVEIEAASALVERLMELTQAKGVLMLANPVLDSLLWVVEKLSHNQPLDEAVWAAQGVWEVPVLHATRLLLEASRPERHVDRLGRMLKLVEDREIEFERPRTPREIEPADLGTQKAPGELQEWLGVSRLRYDHESGGASTLSRLTRSARRAGARRPETGPSPNRELQCLVFLADDRLPVRLLGEAFLAGYQNLVRVRIGVGEAEWMSLDERFPQEELPPSERGHLLTVVFSEPSSTTQPLVSTILLPRTGASSTCAFRFFPNPEAESIDARVLVLHDNRVIQTARLQGPIAPDYGALRGRGPERGIRFLPECGVRPLDAGLDDRRRFKASVLVNRTADNQPQATTIIGLRATRIRLQGLEQAIKAIEGSWNEMPWESNPFPAGDSADVRKLLRTLAVHGRLLYDELVFNQGLHERLQGGEPIQAIAAHEGSFLPLEFCYTREPAAIEGDAPLCPQWKTALETGACPGPCEIQDDGSMLCPLGFWGLRRVIEWHRFNLADRKELLEHGEDFAVQSEPTPRNHTLQPLRRVLFGASERVSVSQVPARTIAKTWTDWKTRVATDAPTMLVLMVHTDEQNRLQSMEMGGQWLDPPRISRALVCKPSSPPADPLVLLLGCGTGVSKVNFRALPAQFRRAGAAIVVSTIAELHAEHAPRLAQEILAALTTDGRNQRTFGEVMLAVRRRCLAGCVPVAMALLSYGDADWRV